MLEGRSRELADVLDRLDAARRGRGFALLVHGDPGIGKTALLGEAGERAAERGFTVLRTGGLEAEVDLPYGALRRLAEPLLAMRDALPAGQARALGSALGLEPPTPQDRFAIPAALLGLLAVATERRPVLGIVDDAQWLDPASREAILFVARRLGAARAGVLLASRDRDGAPPDAPGIERLALTPLDAPSARAVLERGPQELAPAVVEQIAEAAAGNPLALVEIASSLSPDQRAGRAPIEAPLRVGPLLEAAFAERTRHLPGGARRAIAVAAAMESGTVGWLLGALAELGLDEAALDAAERSQAVVVTDGRVAFRHPLARAAAYHAAGEDERRAAHRALAAAAGDPARRAWHLAAAADGVDVAVAGALEDAAVRARAVGGFGEAASAFARAAELSPAPRDRARRRLEAAQDLLTAGETERSLALLEAAEAAAGDEEAPRIARLRGNLAMRLGDPRGGSRLLAAAAERRLDAGDHEAAAVLLLEASLGPIMTGDLDAQAQLVGRALAVTGPEGGELRLLADLFVGAWHAVRARDAMSDAAFAAAEPRLADLDLVGAAEVVSTAALASSWIGGHERAERMAGLVLRAVRDASALGRLPYPLAVHALLELRRGRWAEAAAAAQEAVRLAAETGQEGPLAFARSVAGRLAAARGDAEAARAALDAALSLCVEGQTDGLVAYVTGAHAFAALVAGDADAAIAAARRSVEIHDRIGFRQRASTTAAGDLIEALVLAGRRDEAAAELDRLAAWAEEAGSAWGAVAVTRGRVTLAPEQEVDARAAEAQAAAARLEHAFETARTELAIGDRLRRVGRRADARGPLDRALTVFERLGAAPYVRLTRAGLEATGTSRRSARQSTLGQLTPEERRIAELVAEGRTNREIAATVFLSEKTLERRLTKLYRRLGIASRQELARLTAGD